jgi:hypothetical protein
MILAGDIITGRQCIAGRSVPAPIFASNRLPFFQFRLHLVIVGG